MARRNAKTLGLSNVTFAAGDLFDAVPKDSPRRRRRRHAPPAVRREGRAARAPGGDPALRARARPHRPQRRRARPGRTDDRRGPRLAPARRVAPDRGQPRSRPRRRDGPAPRRVRRRAEHGRQRVQGDARGRRALGAVTESGAVRVVALADHGGRRGACGTRTSHDTRIDGDAVTWLERRPEEDGRNVRRPGRPVERSVDVTPRRRRADARPRVRRGGVRGRRRRRVLLQRPTSGCTGRSSGASRSPITPEPPRERSLRYADMAVSPDGRLIACVRERHGESPSCRSTSSSSSERRLGRAVVVRRGLGLLASPAWSNDGSRSPGSVADAVDAVGRDGGPRRARRGPRDGREAARRRGRVAESLFHPVVPRGELHFISDRTDWWNLCRVDPTAS